MLRESDSDDGQEVFDASEVVDVARVEGQVGGHGGGRDQQIDGPGAARLRPGRDDRRVDASVSPGRVTIEWQRVKGGLGSLQAILTPRSLAGIARRVGTGRELGHGKGANRQFVWELPGIDVIQVDHDRGVDEASRCTRSLIHEA
jgi:hypothetical protein